MSEASRTRSGSPSRQGWAPNPKGVYVTTRRPEPRMMARLAKGCPMIGNAGTKAGHRPRVLIVENDAGVRRSMLLLLQARGFDVRAYPAGQPLLADVALQRPDC